MSLKKSIVKGVALMTLIAGAVALANSLKKNKHGRVLKAAAKDAKARVIEHAKTLGATSMKSFAHIVDTVMKEYAEMNTLTRKELEDLSAELKSGWKATEKSMMGAKKPSRRASSGS